MGLNKESELNFREGQYISLNNLGTIHNSLKLNDKAYMYFKKAEKYSIETKAFEELVIAYDGISRVFKDRKNIDSALVYAEKATELASTINNPLYLAYQYNTLASLYVELKKFELAKDLFNKSLKTAIELKDKRLELTIYSNQAIIEMEEKNYDKAFNYLERAIILRKELNITVNADDQDLLFSEYYTKKNDFKSAYEYYLKYCKIQDSLYTTNIAGQLNEMRTKYETEKKEKENLLLQNQNKSFRTTKKYLTLTLSVLLLVIIGALISFKRIKKSKQLIDVQKELVEEKQKETLDSINYAKRIQYALLPGEKFLKTHLPEHFILFKPKAVVSGDFYWGSPVENGFVYVTGDCTVHGVPGAFMSVLNISKLNRIINENRITRPDLILNQLRKEIILALNPEGSIESGKDGMDAVVCSLNIKEMKLEYAAANNSFYIVRNKQIIKCKADKMPVGIGFDNTIPFTYNKLSLEIGDTIYTFTDGFADQFGGLNGKKFKYKKLEEFLISINDKTLVDQKTLLNTAFEDWKGELEQVDDICIIGVKINTV